MTSTYLHVNCVVGVACAEAFANKNIAARNQNMLRMSFGGNVVAIILYVLLVFFRFTELKHNLLLATFTCIIPKLASRRAQYC